MDCFRSRLPPPEIKNFLLSLQKYNLPAKVSVLTDLQFIMSGISPLTLNSGDDEGSQQQDRNSSLLLPELSGIFSFLVDAKKRAEGMMELYPQLKNSLVKAKAAYALALYRLEANDPLTAEKLLYECLYILDHLESKSPLLPPIVSELGAQAAIIFGDVLLMNRKYKYAMEAYEGGLVNLRLQNNFGSQGQTLARKIAMVAVNNKDSQRALQYYLHILEQAKQESKINEVIHVTLVAAYEKLPIYFFPFSPSIY